MIKVDLVDHMGSDLSVVNAARVSFDKTSSYEEDRAGGWTLPAKDHKLIQYLAEHGHWSPFSHCFLSFRVKAPLFVARQLAKHQVGLAWNEVSRRYVDSEPEFYVPESWRKRAENVKQGSSDETVDLNEVYQFTDEPSAWDDYTVAEMFYEHMQRGDLLYKRMIEQGVCPEQARMVLPQSMMTEWIWSGSLYAFARVCKLRLDSHTQVETREVAKKIDTYCNTKFPVSWKALMNAAE